MPEKCYKYCPQGYYYDATSQPTSGTKICSVCGVGHFCPTGATHPAACPAGFVQPSPTGATCNACPSGQYAHEGETCVPCPSNYFCTPTKTPCPEGTQLKGIGGTSSSSCTPCPSGQFNLTPGKTCKPCPIGSMSDTAGGHTCTACPAGTTNHQKGGTTCTVASCPAGKYLDKSGPSPTCKGCTAGVVGQTGGQHSHIGSNSLFWPRADGVVRI